MTTLSLGLAPLGFLDLAPPVFISLAARAGFTSVGLRTRAAVPGGAEYPMAPNPTLLRETKRAMADTGIRVTSVEQVGLFRDTDIGSLRPMLEAGAEIGAARVLCSGDDDDISVVAGKLAERCAVAGEFGLSPDLEFMPFRAVKTLQQAREVVLRSGACNATIAIDALHLMRSGGNPAELAQLEPHLIGCVQLCDAPLTPPPADQLATEARERRLSPGEGELPLLAMLDAVGAGRALEAEVPLALAMPDASALERARHIFAATSTLLTGRPAA